MGTGWESYIQTGEYSEAPDCILRRVSSLMHEFKLTLSVLHPCTHPNTINHQGSIQLLIDVIDEDFDYIFTHSPVDDIYVELTLIPSSTFTQETWYTGDNDRAEIMLSFRVQCHQNFYGSDCSIKCVDTDTDGVGHYTCDGTTGDKNCISGWTDANSNCLTRKPLALST